MMFDACLPPSGKQRFFRANNTFTPTIDRNQRSVGGLAQWKRDAYLQEGGSSQSSELQTCLAHMCLLETPRAYI